MTHPLFKKHQSTLEQAVQAIQLRESWQPFPDIPQAYEKVAAIEGEKSFSGLLSKPFVIPHQSAAEWVGKELSPYAFPLNITYPHVELDQAFTNIRSNIDQWHNAGRDTWIGISLEILHRLQLHIFELAYAVMHTTGQPFTMAFQGGSAHAIYHGLEAIAYAHSLYKQIPDKVIWQLPGKDNAPLIEKLFKIHPKGIGLIIGCSTFTLWNAYPGLFANLATGNAVIVKPHPTAILPLAITVKVAREVLSEHGFSPDLINLIAHDSSSSLAKELSLRPEIDLIDFTGSTENGEWLEQHNQHAIVFAEKGAVNPIIIDSTDDVKGMARNIALSLCLYSGQMCTTPRSVYIPQQGIHTPEGVLSFDDTVRAIVDALNKLTSDPAKAVELLGTIQNEETINRINKAYTLGDVLCESKTINHPNFPGARVRTPLLIKVMPDDTDTLYQELFGPIVRIIPTENTISSIKLASDIAQRSGILTLSAYSLDEQVKNYIRQIAIKMGCVLSFNLTKFSLMNETMPFSDFHGTRKNRSANTFFIDNEFISKRFFITQEHRQL